MKWGPMSRVPGLGHDKGTYQVLFDGGQIATFDLAYSISRFAGPLAT